MMVKDKSELLKKEGQIFDELILREDKINRFFGVNIDQIEPLVQDAFRDRRPHDLIYHLISDIGWLDESFETIQELFNGIVKSSNGIVLDLGCGCGAHYSILEGKSKRVIGLDISSDALKIYKMSGKNEKLVNGDGCNLPIKSNSIDMVFTSEVIEHVRNPEIFTSEISRVLKIGGELFLTTTTYEFFIFEVLKLVLESPKAFPRTIYYYFRGLFSEKYRGLCMKQGLEHPDHLHAFMKNELIERCKKHGLITKYSTFIIVQAIFPQIRFKKRILKMLFFPINRLTNFLNQIFIKKFRVNNKYGPNIVLYCRKTD